jgi:hypothetical protein
MMSTSVLVSQRSPLTEEEMQAIEPIEQYFLGHANDDAAFMRQAFLPMAHIESMREGVFTSWSLDVYCHRFKHQPASDEAMRKRTIDWIEVKGSAACARITLVHGLTTFIDYFVLLKTIGGWRIANKVFHGATSEN